MPRNPGTGIYTLPAGTTAITNTTIASTPYNGMTSDVELDLNTARPIIAGGTGATNAATARTNLNAEVNTQTVTNYDSQVWESGSFKSDVGAVNSPDGAGAATNRYVGTVQVYDTDCIIVEARSPGTNITYVRRKSGSPGTWGAWAADSGPGAFVQKAGDTMTGQLTVSQTGGGALALNKPASGVWNTISGLTNNVMRWRIDMGDGSAEGGTADGSHFAINRFANDGTYLGAPFSIVRSTGNASFSGTVTVGSSGAQSTIYFRDGSHYLTWDGSAYTLQGGTLFTGNSSINVGNGTVLASNHTATNSITNYGWGGDVGKSLWYANQAGSACFNFDGTNFNYTHNIIGAGGVGRLLGRNEFSASAGGYAKLGPSGVIIQWGYVGTSGDGWIYFPIAFPNVCEAAVCVPAMGGGLPTGTILSWSVMTVQYNAFYVQKRFTNAGVTNPASNETYWMAIGY